MGRVALPEMKKYKYANSLATGSVAAGGTLDGVTLCSPETLARVHPRRSFEWDRVLHKPQVSKAVLMPWPRICWRNSATKSAWIVGSPPETVTPPFDFSK